MIFITLAFFFMFGMPAAEATCLAPISEPMRAQMTAMTPDLESLASQFRHVVHAIDRHIGSSEMTLSTLQHPLVRERLRLPSRSERAVVRLSDLNVTQLHQFAQLLPRFPHIDADLRGHIQLYVHYRQLHAIASNGVRNMESALTETESAAALRRFQFAAAQWATLGSADLVPSWLAHFDRRRLFRPFANENWSMQSIQQKKESIYQRIGSAPFTQAYEQAETLCSCSRPSSRPLNTPQYVTVQIAEDAAGALAASAPPEPTPNPAARERSSAPRGAQLSARDAELRRLRAQQEQRMETLRQEQQRERRREERRLNARASVPTRAELVRQGTEVMNRALRENQGNLPRDFSSLRYRVHAEVRIPDSPHRDLTQGEYEAIMRRHEQAITAAERAANAQTDPELRVSAIRQVLHNEFGRSYAGHTSSIITALQTDDRDCEVLSDLFLDYFSRHPEHIPPGWKLAVQDFEGHIQTVLIPNDLTDRRVWVPSSGTIEPLARAPIYRPALALRGTLRDFGRALRRPPDSAFLLRNADVPPSSPEALARFARNSRGMPDVLGRSYSDNHGYLFYADGSPPPERATLPEITTLERPRLVTLAEAQSRTASPAPTTRATRTSSDPAAQVFGSQEYLNTLTDPRTRDLVSYSIYGFDDSFNRATTGYPAYLHSQFLPDILRNRRDLPVREALEELSRRVLLWAADQHLSLGARYDMMNDLCATARQRDISCRSLSPEVRRQLDELNAEIDRWAVHPEQVVSEMNATYQRQERVDDLNAEERSRYFARLDTAYRQARDNALNAGENQDSATEVAESARQREASRLNHAAGENEINPGTLIAAVQYATTNHPGAADSNRLYFKESNPMTQVFAYLIDPANVGRAESTSSGETTHRHAPPTHSRIERRPPASLASPQGAPSATTIDHDILEASALYSLPLAQLNALLGERIQAAPREERDLQRRLLERMISLARLPQGSLQSTTVCGDLAIDPMRLHELADLAERINYDQPEIPCPADTHPTRTPNDEYRHFRTIAASQGSDT